MRAIVHEGTTEARAAKRPIVSAPDLDSQAEATRPTDQMQRVAFYCVCDERHFFGLVALVNSLRLQGHDDKVYVLDCGLERWQRAVLAQEREVAVFKVGGATHPMLLKTMLPLAHPAHAMILVDVDVIFTGRVDSLVEEVERSGKALLFPNDRIDRFQPAWELLGFGPPTPHTYVASGQMILPAEDGGRILTLWAQGLRRLSAEPELAGSGLSEEDAFFFPDMDVLNALIGPAIQSDSFILADTATTAYWPFEGLRVSDLERLGVESADGSRPVLLHHILDKPWNGLVAPNAYSRLMTRLLCDKDVALRAPLWRIPYALRGGIGGGVARSYVKTRLWLRRSLRGRLGIRARLARKYPALLKSRYHYRPSQEPVGGHISSSDE
jgi:hypothetical protein